MKKEEMHEAADSWQHGEVLNSIRQMPFRDLVAAIEGEEVAAMLPTPQTSSTVPSTPKKARIQNKRRTSVGVRHAKT
jgi:hypothetical protein